MKVKTPYKVALIVAGLAVLAYTALIGARFISYTGGYFGHGAGDLALMQAEGRGDRTLTRLVLAFGVAPDTVQPGTGHSPLSGAAYQGDAWAVERLLEHGANPNGAAEIVDNFSEPDITIPYTPGVPMPVYLLDRPLCMAARRGDREIAALLRERGARYEFVDALFLADELFVHDALAKDPQLAETLKRVAPRMLNLAVDDNNVPAITLMLDLGLDPTQKGEYGPSPLETAQITQRTELVKLFESHAPVESAPTEE